MIGAIIASSLRTWSPHSRSITSGSTPRGDAREVRRSGTGLAASAAASILARPRKRADEAGFCRARAAALHFSGGAVDRRRRLRRSRSAVARAFPARRPAVRRPVGGRRAAAARARNIWLGTDTLGRDLLSRLLYGARTSLVIGLVANGAAVVIGMIVGVVAGYVGGFLRQCADALHRPDDGLSGAAAGDRAGGALHPSLWIVAMVIALVNWVQVARIVFTETRGLAERDFILAERVAGRGACAHPVPPHPAASAPDRDRLGHARHRDHGSSGSDAVLPRHRRSAAAAVLGQHHLREPDLLHRRALAGVLPGRRSSWLPRSPSTSSATRCATPRPDAARGGG